MILSNWERRAAQVSLAPGVQLVTRESFATRQPTRFGPADPGPSWTHVAVWPGPEGHVTQILGDDTATLLEAIHHPSTIPDDLALSDVARLLLDGLLVLHWEGKTWSGPGAQACFAWEAVPPPGTATSRLSHRALRYAASLGTREPATLARRLYRYGTAPLSPRWRRRLPDSSAVRRYVEAGEATPPQMTEVQPRTAEPIWRRWRGELEPPLRDTGSLIKLYLSPTIDAVPAAWHGVTRLFQTSATPIAAKYAARPEGLLRPDKMVLYYRNEEAMRSGADFLISTLTGVPAQGVPFSASLTNDGLLSWGCDASAELTGDTTGHESWRIWLTERLGSYLSRAMGTGLDTPAWLFALRRVSLDGIATDTWTPPSWFRSHPTAEHVDR